MRLGSLFSGYGGLDLAVEQVLGTSTAWLAENDPGASRILARHYPDVPNLGDVSKADWSTVEPVDILCAGFPCQPVSHAGKRLGDNDERWLWDDVARAVRELRPGLVVLENVRGLLSAGGGRLFGRVLGTLAELGYDAQWHGLRAADVGAPHGRWRVFITAYPASRGRREGWAESARIVGRPDVAERGSSALLPTPRSSDSNGAGMHGGGGVDLRTAVALLPTPTTEPTTGNGHARNLGAEAKLLPTPAVNDMGEGKTPDAWDEWTAKMQAAHGNGNGHGKSLAIEAQRLLPTPRASDGEKGGPNQRGSSGDLMLPSAVQRLLPTPTAADHKASGGSSPSDVTLTDAIVRTNLGEQENPRHAHTPEGRPGEVLRDVRDADGAQAVQRSARGQDEIPGAAELFAGLRQPSGGSREGHAALASEAAQGVDLSGLRNDGAAARSPRGPESCEQRPGELDDALRELSSQVALAGGSGEATGDEPVVAWGDYEPAIRRWEQLLGRPAPAPTERDWEKWEARKARRLASKLPAGMRGSIRFMHEGPPPRLSAKFVEFLMGLPTGHVTDVPGLNRNAQLKALGNGVVPAQAAHALRWLLEVAEAVA